MRWKKKIGKSGTPSRNIATTRIAANTDGGFVLFATSWSVWDVSGLSMRYDATNDMKLVVTAHQAALAEYRAQRAAQFAVDMGQASDSDIDSDVFKFTIIKIYKVLRGSLYAKASCERCCSDGSIRFG